MMKNFLFVLVLITFLAFLFSCGRKGKSNLLPAINNADSAAVMFYDSIGNPRFFKYTKVYEIKEMKSVLDDINDDVVKLKTDCQSEGKIYFYKSKEAVDVVYFNSADSCMRYSFIINGEKFFVHMSAAAKEYIEKLKPLSREPQSNQ
jgi:predicted small lipoprotein YifL